MSARRFTVGRSRAVLAAGCVTALLVTGIAATTMIGAPQPSVASDTSSARPHSGTVTRQTLTDSSTFPASLGYGSPTALAGAGTGTITWLPRYGDVIGRDGVLYRQDEQPVRAMHGSVPLYRTLTRGLRGADVAQLNDNLADLGYNVLRDDRFGARTSAAVLRWQKDRGLPRTGEIDATQVAFVDGDIRVDTLSARLGSPAASDVYSYTSTRRLVTASPSVRDAGQFGDGTTVSVGFGDDSSRVPGRVRSVDGADEGKVTVTIELDGDVPDGVTAASSVDVEVRGKTVEDVLTVPVNALLAGSSRDGYVVEVLRGDGPTRRVPVTTGFAADGRVEITGKLAEGDRVVVP